MKLHNIEIDQFTQAYIVCALWSSTDGNENPLDDNYDETDLVEETVKRIVNDCKIFQIAQAKLLQQAYQSDVWIMGERYNAGDAGHDFWLTRNGHGAGFWDRGLGKIGQDLTDACKAYGECYIYVGDDGQMYI